MFDRELVKDFKTALAPFLPLLIVMAIVFSVGLVIVSYAVFSGDKKVDRSYVTAASDLPAAAAQQITEQSVEPVTPQNQPVTQQVTAQPPTKKPAAMTTPEPTPPPIPVSELSVSFFGGGCAATIKAQPGARVVIGAFNDSKGGESHYFIPASGSLIQRTSGIWGMTSFVQILADDGSTEFYKTSTVTVEKCPPAGVSEW